MTRPYVYLCGNMDGLSVEDVTGWRVKAAARLAPEFDVLDPSDLQPRPKGDFYVPEGFADNPRGIAEIVEPDIAAIRRSRVLLRHFVRFSEGSPMEMVYAKFFGVPCVVFGIEDPAKASPWLLYHATKVFGPGDEGLEQAVDLIKRAFLYPGETVERWTKDFENRSLRQMAGLKA